MPCLEEKKRDIPGSAYIVYTNDVLKEIADKQPETLDELEKLMKTKKQYSANSKHFWEKILNAYQDRS